MKIAIIGSGLTGLSCARMLTDNGLSTVVLDKGRGIGGRLSTRRGDGVQFDHGAQYISAPTDPGFAGMLAQAERSGAVAQWEDRGFVGLPGMTGLAKYMAEGIDVRQGVEVQRVSRTESGWAVSWEDTSLDVEYLICTVPAPQAAALFPDLSGVIMSAQMDPCLTLMLAAPSDADCPFVTHRDPEGDIGWIAQDSAKPGRTDLTCWVAQAGVAYSRAHLEKDKGEIAHLMLPLVADLIGLKAEPLYLSAHRWRYAFTAQPLGQPFLQDDGLLVGGDWCLGPKADSAWASGTAMAKALLSGGARP